MLKELVLIVEDNPQLLFLLKTLLERSKVNCIFATNCEDAMELFRRNRGVITYIALDGNLSGNSSMESPETLHFAEYIGRCADFKGKVFPMSSLSSHNEILEEALNGKGEVLTCDTMKIKLETIKEICKRASSHKDA